MRKLHSIKGGLRAQLTKNATLLGVILCVLFFAAGSVQAGGVTEEWVARYNGPANDYDEARAIAVDGSGNIYVTGRSEGSGTYSDYATIKCDPNGNELWVRRYNNGQGSQDYVTAIAVDYSGNVYVTGKSGGSGTGHDYATIKYDTNGNELWVRRYNGPGNDEDETEAIALDGSGNVYVTGSSSGPGTYGDYATIKYDPNGNELWVRRYNGPGNYGDCAEAIALDSSGNIYVTGYSDGSGTYNYDCATIKYDPNGGEQWVRRYNGLANGFDSAFAISVDGSGNIYVTGGSEGYGIGWDYATIKYDPNGNQLWVRRYNGPGNDHDTVIAIAVDGSGNIYVTGYSGGSGTERDYATIKYDPNGNELWVRRYNGPGNGSDSASAIAVDGSGNVYVTGTSKGSGTDSDYATIKYDTNGNQLWVIRYNGPGNDWDGATAIAVDVSSNIYVTGGSEGSGTASDYATIKYSQNRVILTMQTEPAEVNTVTPELGEHYYLSGTIVDINAERFVDCPDVSVFNHWEGDVNDPNSANTTVFMDTDKTVTAVFVDGRECGDECHPYPAADLDKNCKVNFFDFAMFAAQWLECTDPNCD